MMSITPASGDQCGMPIGSGSDATRGKSQEEAMKLPTAALATSALALSLLATPAWAQRRLLLKASDVHPAGYPTVVAVENLGKKLERATNGRLSVQMFASMQLGGEKEAIEQAQVGALQLARVSVGVLGTVVNDLDVFNLPFLF